MIEEVKTITTPVPEVDMEKCTLCGKCNEICQFKAIVVIAETVLTFHELCHSCGGCMAVCPEKAITLVNGKAVLDEKKCDLDGLCIPACPKGAIEYEDDYAGVGCGF